MKRADAIDRSPLLNEFTQWAADRAQIRAMLVTSSRAIPDAPIDELSDYDIILVVQDIHPFVEDKSWIEDFGPVLVAYWDPIYRFPDYDMDQVGNVIQYADGLKIDFTLWPVELLRQIATGPNLPDGLDAGYLVLLDKDGLTDGMQAPTYRAYIPTQPSDETYQTVIENFFSDVPYVAKCLVRDELLPAKWCLDYDMKHIFLRQVLEWRVQQEHNWSLPVGVLGRGLKKHLPAAIWRELERTYVGASIPENWNALSRTVVLFRKVAIEVADDLGYEYPLDLEQRVVAYVDRMKQQARTKKDV